MFDPNTEFGERVARRLKEDSVIWLTTVRRDLIPQPTPVWFLWNGDTFLIFSEPSAQKIRNIRRNPKVALNFDGNGTGGDIIVFWGEAQIEEERPSANEMAEYLQKYQTGLTQIQMTPESFAESYSVPVRVKPTNVRGY